MVGKKLRAYFRQALVDPRAEEGARFGLAHLDEVMTNHFTKKKLVNILSAMSEFGREGCTRADFADWQGKALVVASEDDRSFKDLEWFTDNLVQVVVPNGILSRNVTKAYDKEEIMIDPWNYMAPALKIKSTYRFKNRFKNRFKKEVSTQKRCP